jgi:hypothetical protein
MAIFPRPVSPKAAIADFVAYLKHGTSREQRIGAFLAVLATGIIVFEFVIDTKVNMEPEPTIIYTQSWSANRTDAEIIAQQKKEQAAREAAMKERQRQFQRLQKQLGIE